jgi:hypothetical protein
MILCQRSYYSQLIVAESATRDNGSEREKSVQEDGRWRVGALTLGALTSCFGL